MAGDDCYDAMTFCCNVEKYHVCTLFDGPAGFVYSVLWFFIACMLSNDLFDFVPKLGNCEVTSEAVPE